MCNDFPTLPLQRSPSITFRDFAKGRCALPAAYLRSRPQPLPIMIRDDRGNLSVGRGQAAPLASVLGSPAPRWRSPSGHATRATQTKRATRRPPARPIPPTGARRFSGAGTKSLSVLMAAPPGRLPMPPSGARRVPHAWPQPPARLRPHDLSARATTCVPDIRNPCRRSSSANVAADI
jgi:hypothetical protein